MRLCAHVFSGGGGNRTRVPRRLHESFYVRSRFFEFAGRVPNRQGSPRAIRQRCLATDVADLIRGESDLATGFWDSPTKARSRD